MSVIMKFCLAVRADDKGSFFKSAFMAKQASQISARGAKLGPFKSISSFFLRADAGRLVLLIAGL